MKHQLEEIVTKLHELNKLVDELIKEHNETAKELGFPDCQILLEEQCADLAEGWEIDRGHKGRIPFALSDVGEAR